VKYYGKDGIKTSQRVIRYGKYGKKASWIIKDMNNMEETQVE
jgi:hypothetical protein